MMPEDSMFVTDEVTYTVQNGKIIEVETEAVVYGIEPDYPIFQVHPMHFMDVSHYGMFWWDGCLWRKVSSETGEKVSKLEERSLVSAEGQMWFSAYRTVFVFEV